MSSNIPSSPANVFFLSFGLYDTSGLTPRCVIKVFGDVFMLSRCLLDFSVDVGAFVIGLSQISSLFSYESFIRRARRLSSRLLKQGYLVKRLQSSFRKFYGGYGDLLQQYDSLLTNEIRLLTNFMTLIQSLTFYELRVVSMEYVQRFRHAGRQCLPFQTPCSVPFWDLLMLKLFRPFFRNLQCYSRLSP